MSGSAEEYLSNYESWWHVDHDDDGHVTRVWVNKPTGKARGVWTFDLTRRAIEVVQREHVGETTTRPADVWQIADGDASEVTAALASLVGRQTAKAVVRRLYPAASASRGGATA